MVFKSKFAYILEAQNPQDCVWKNLHRITVKTILQKEGQFTTKLNIWYTNLFPIPQAKDTRAAKAAVDEECESLEKIPEWDLTSHKWKSWSMKQGRRAQKFILLHWWTSVICRIPNWRRSTKIQRSSCTPKRHCERWFWILNNIHWTRMTRWMESPRQVLNKRRRTHEGLEPGLSRWRSASVVS